MSELPRLLFLWEDGADQSFGAPQFETAGAAGADIRANLATRDRASGVTLGAGQRALISTGLRVAVPPGFEMQLRPRSGLALKQGVTLLNSPGTIDSDYRGPLGVILINHSDQPFLVEHGARIAQAVIAPVCQMPFVEVSDLTQTARGAGGFGSTGTG